MPITSSLPSVEFDLEKFELEVAVLCGRELSFMEAIVLWCDENEIEMDLISGIIKKNVVLKSRLEDEARRKNLLKR